MVLLYALTLAHAAPPTAPASEGLAHVSEVDAINCRLDEMLDSDGTPL